MTIPTSAICFFRDGGQWCCTGPDFTNLQESPVGFGETLHDAWSAYDLARGDEAEEQEPDDMLEEMKFLNLMASRLQSRYLKAVAGALPEL